MARRAVLQLFILSGFYWDLGPYLMGGIGIRWRRTTKENQRGRCGWQRRC